MSENWLEEHIDGLEDELSSITDKPKVKDKSLSDLMEELEEEDDLRKSGIATSTSIRAEDGALLEDEISVVNKLRGKSGHFSVDNWENFLNGYLREVVPDFVEIADLLRVHTDITAKMATTTALFFVSMATRRAQKVSIKQFETHLNLWAIVFAQSGSLKTEVRSRLNKARKIASISKLPDGFSPEGVITVLSQMPNSQAAWLKDEMSGLFKGITKKDYMSDLPEILSALYDCDEIVDRFTRKSGHEAIEMPYLTVVGTTTGASFGAMNDDLFTQGLMMRFLYCLEFDNPHERTLDISEVHDASYRGDLGEILSEMAMCPIEVFRFKKTTQEWDEWMKYVEFLRKRSSYSPARKDLVYSYYARIITHTFKVAALLTLSQKKVYGLRSENATTAYITPAILNAAILLMKFYEDEFLQVINFYRSQAESEPVQTSRDLKNYVFTAIRSDPCKVKTFAQLIRDLDLSKRQLEISLEMLVEGELVNVAEAGKAYKRKGPKPKIFWLVGEYKDANEASKAWQQEFDRLAELQELKDEEEASET